MEGLSISFNGEAVVKNISFQIEPGKTTAIIGESGSGKTLTALSVLNLLPAAAAVQGKIFFSDAGLPPVNILSIPQKELRHLRGNRISMVFQEPMSSLNPLHTCGSQVAESLMVHKKMSRRRAIETAENLFTLCELPNPKLMLKRYPHELSGGQKQRVMIAMAMSCKPALLIADEPTTALDVLVQQNILSLLKRLRTESGMSLLLISHDLGLVADVADKIIVMYKGEIVEQGDTDTVLSNPKSAYTSALLACRPAAGVKGLPLPTVADIIAGKKLLQKSFAETRPSAELLLQVKDLSVSYQKRRGIFKKNIAGFKAVDDVSFSIRKNEIVGIAGESGSGKSTLGATILGLQKADAGDIIFNGKNIVAMDTNDLRLLRREMQVVFQDPYGSLNPSVTIGEAISEPIKVHHKKITRRQRLETTAALLKEVGLSKNDMRKYPHMFSGGERQRICIARSLALVPDFIVFDESVSALDVSVQAGVLNLINELKHERGFTALFISHDLHVMRYICDRILVMHRGKIVEEGRAEDIFADPQHAYTQSLLAALPGKKLAV